MTTAAHIGREAFFFSVIVAWLVRLASGESVIVLKVSAINVDAEAAQHVLGPLGFFCVGCVFGARNSLEQVCTDLPNNVCYCRDSVCCHRAVLCGGHGA